MKTPFKCSVEDYHQIIASGVPDGKSVELLEGEIIIVSPIEDRITKDTVALKN